MNISKTFSARVKPQTLALLKELATKDNRTINNYIVKIILDHLEKHHPDYKPTMDEDSKESNRS